MEALRSPHYENIDILQHPSATPTPTASSMERMASRPAHNRVQPDGSHPTKPKQKRVPSRPGAMPQHPPSRPSRVFDGSDAPRPEQPHVAVATTPKEVASSGFVHEKDSTNPGMAAALRTCPVTPCPVQHGDRVRAESNRVRHGEQASEPAAYYRPCSVQPSPRSVQHGAHGLRPAHNRVRAH